jgi:polysaccharide export outer membrane protein
MSDEYILQPGDVVEIKFLHNPELNETAAIRPDGRISLQMIDEVRSAGLTPAQLDDLLTQRYGLLVPKAMISVMVRTFTTDCVYVGGEVRHPRMITLKGRMNALQAVLMAGGFGEDAKISRVVILSRGPDSRPVAREVNLKKVMAGDIDFEDYRLRPSDIVFVPRTCLASTAHFMSSVYRLIPSQVFFGFTYEVNDAAPDSD